MWTIFAFYKDFYIIINNQIDSLAIRKGVAFKGKGLFL